eukprot:gene7566-9011_t
MDMVFSTVIDLEERRLDKVRRTFRKETEELKKQSESLQREREALQSKLRDVERDEQRQREERREAHDELRKERRRLEDREKRLHRDKEQESEREQHVKEDLKTIKEDMTDVKSTISKLLAFMDTISEIQGTVSACREQIVEVQQEIKLVKSQQREVADALGPQTTTQIVTSMASAFAAALRDGTPHPATSEESTRVEDPEKDEDDTQPSTQNEEDNEATVKEDWEFEGYFDKSESNQADPELEDSTGPEQADENLKNAPGEEPAEAPGESSANLVATTPIQGGDGDSSDQPQAMTRPEEERIKLDETTSVEENSSAYSIAVITGESMGAGTDATVKLELRRASGEWWAPALGKSTENPSNPFENGKTDTFEVISPTDVGELTAVRVSHDGKGWGGDWQLASIVVRNKASGKEWVFPCNKAWVKKNEPLEVE